LDRILACALDVLIDELGMLNCGINIRDNEAGRFSMQASRNLTDAQLQAIRHFRQKPGGDFCQQAVDSGQVVFVPNLASNELFQDTLGVLWGGSYVNVPLWSQREIVGSMGLVTHVGQQLTEYELEVLKIMGNVIGMAVKSVQHYEHARYIAMVDERDRLARELHDTLAQSLGCIIQQVNITEELLSRNQIEKAKSSLLEVGQISKATYTDVREAIFSLRAAPSIESGFLSTLREYLTVYETQYSVITELTIDSEEALRLSPETSIQVLRIIQEALSNSRKHSQAKYASVRFQQVGDTIVITVADDGCGFNPAEVANKGPLHLGLQIMHERAESVGGKLTIDSSPGHGTRVTILLETSQGE